MSAGGCGGLPRILTLQEPCLPFSSTQREIEARRTRHLVACVAHSSQLLRAPARHEARSPLVREENTEREYALSRASGFGVRETRQGAGGSGIRRTFRR